MAVATGMRLKEVVGLRWSDVDRNAGVLHMSENSKTGRWDIPMSDTVRGVLDGLVRHLRSPMVFVDDEGTPSELEVTRAMDTQVDTWPTNAFSVFLVPVPTR